ncbi:dTDP-4-dehydrorhamnose 3,5-epimerase [Mesorhizobium sp. M2D.F.Ca.ET.185.01.1.1]|uniref:dTDP-4-dehydrorhamnose 3,5-epimerase n=1 Tax=unclassified Mesorhizobium TaxID=325217 RepID=UPI000FCA251C|nr:MULTISPECIES: dTDP-4-dehydrorhamnose 3,5-epimerase [unclassified Mesorhizobium]TGP52760.1 dTDP-4-dehydrorhamnose 3,5-epimerase [bacterium M00.F.Ca.ET.230.01.1.1]TGP80970.1 dTDP-4-dehydrorhamnose 3,5-epimerase [bacterium M00.F.Ca.ET.227.01.1.1]TGP90753.1 dTDP-4-dehydrorhamnose 3,5-epimerase [bacterium M00.F.Ca.ET.221.01.1.1]TGP97432.1 dTDP-4-dehydrorhamnose 3,5-epimerase [bacterium M00.F.Ca.ET.222.01.1.1]TGT75964.1 dTDP-4-dehydrorhamnose 3,5-epimerase [bacterium M00.F.Ca.ET.159.01.1.1]TGT85
MRFHPSSLSGPRLVEPEPIWDERGFFSRTFCVSEFSDHGLTTSFVQHSMSYSRHKHTLRGMHFQHPPHAEVKLVSCIAGSIYDVIVDLRPQSPSYLKWEGFELTASNRRMLYIPCGFAHGFQTLGPDSTVSYMISEFYTPAAARGLRYDDPRLAIDWPAPPSILSDRDRHWPLLEADARRPVLQN